MINAILYIAEHGCKWRGLPEKFGYWHRIYMRVNRWAKKGVTFSLSPGQSGDVPEGRKLLETLEDCGWEGTQVIMDKAYEGDETRQLVFDLGMEPVVPPKSNRLFPWEYDREIYKKRNEVERLFRRLKGFRRIFSRFDKLDVVFRFFINFSLIADKLISVNRP